MKTPDYNLPSFDKEASSPRSSPRSRVSQAQDQMPSPSPHQPQLEAMGGGAKGLALETSPLRGQDQRPRRGRRSPRGRRGQPTQAPNQAQDRDSASSKTQ